MIQQANLSIYITLGLTFIINLYLFEFIYDQIIYREMRIFKKWKFSWTTILRFILTVALIAIIFTIVFYRQYSKITTLTNAESWLSALDVALAHVILVFPIAFLLVFVIHSIVTGIIVIAQIRFLDGMLKVSPELSGKSEKDEHYETRMLLSVPFIKAPKSRLFVFRWLFPNFLFHCGSTFLLLWIFLDVVVATLVSYPIAYWTLKILFVDTIDLQVILFGTFDPNLGWQYPSTFGFTLLSNHVTTTTNWLIQQPVIISIFGFLGLVTTAIISLATIKKAVEALREKTEKSEKQETG